MDKTYEVCPYCEKEVEVEAKRSVQKCPNCGEWIVVCSMCEKEHCGVCVLEERAHRLNETAPHG